MTLRDVVAAHAERDPDRIALIADSDGCTRTYGQLRDHADSVASALRARGVAVGDRVVIWMENSVAWVESLLGCGAAGAIAVPLNPDWRDAEASYVLSHCEPRAIVCDAGIATRAAALAPDALVVASGAPFDELTATPAEPIAEAIDIDGPGLIMYTSGTTSGQPKGVVQSHRTVIECMAGAYADSVQAGPADRCLFVTPLFHGNAMGGCLSALSVGASAVFCRRFSRSDFWRLIDLYRPTYLFTLLPIVNIALSGPSRPLMTENSLRTAFVLGAGAERARLGDRLGGAAIVDCYGLSECSIGTYTRPEEEIRPGSAGRPFPGVQMRIVDERGAQCPPGQLGEVVFTGRGVLLGYFRPTEQQRSAFRDGWFHTGDLGYFDHDGYFYFADRKKDIVRRGGENISSIEVESVLREAPGVRDVAIVARPDDVLGERVAAFVIAAAGAAPTLEQLRAHAATALAAYKLPEELVLVEEFPRTPSGKIQKFELRKALAG